jgi:hypothetical protein
MLIECSLAQFELGDDYDGILNDWNDRGPRPLLRN